MTKFLLSIVSVLAIAAFVGGCSTTVRTDNGHAVTTGVHTR